jgi:hypothetical protein
MAVCESGDAVGSPEEECTASRTRGKSDCHGGTDYTSSENNWNRRFFAKVASYELPGSSTK